MAEQKQPATDISPPVAKASYHHGDLRQALLVAAEQELGEKGIEGFSLRGVAKRAGVSHAAPAHHFRDTSDLLTALAALGAQRFLQSMKERQAQAATDPRSQFIASGQGYVAFALANPALFDLMFGSKRPDITAEEFTKPSREAFMTLVDDVANLTGENPLETAAGRVRILAAWSLVHGLSKLLNAGRLGFVTKDVQDDLDGLVKRAIECVAPDSSKT